jgi:hypothetical protein
MQKAAEYRRHAEQCRVLARAVDGEHRRQLLQMAADWDALAAERADLVRRHPEIAFNPTPPPADDEPPRTSLAG